MNQRVDYVDLVKGLTIFLVVWVHTSAPFWLTPILVNSIFFMLSGFFFKKKPLMIFAKEKMKYLLVPFTFFYLISYPFRVIVHLWDTKSLSGFDWNHIFDVFDISSRTDYLYVNVPLWFILCLLVIQFLYFFILDLPKTVIFFIGILCIGLKDVFYSIPMPFMINASFYYLGFFILGNLFGKRLLELFMSKKTRFFSCLLSLILVLIYNLSNVDSLSDYVKPVLEAICLFSVLIIFLFFCSWFNSEKNVGVIRFLGTNTLSILGLHVPVLIFIKRLSHALLGEPYPLLGFVHSVITMSILYYIIIFCNKYIPFLVGKKQ